MYFMSLVSFIPLDTRVVCGTAVCRFFLWLLSSFIVSISSRCSLSSCLTIGQSPCHHFMLFAVGTSRCEPKNNLLALFFFFIDSTNALDWAAARGHQDVVMFLIQNRKEGCTAQALDWSSHGGHHNINHSLSRGAKLRVSVSCVGVVLALASPSVLTLLVAVVQFRQGFSCCRWVGKGRRCCCSCLTIMLMSLSDVLSFFFR